MGVTTFLGAHRGYTKAHGMPPVGFRRISYARYRNIGPRLHLGVPDYKAGLNHTQQPQDHDYQDNNHQNSDDSAYSSTHALTSPIGFPTYAPRSRAITRTRTIMTTTVITRFTVPPRIRNVLSRATVSRWR